MFASNFLLFRSTLPVPRGTGQVPMNPTIEVGKEVPRHSQYGLMLDFPSTYVQAKDRPVECGPATKDPCEFPTLHHQNTKIHRRSMTTTGTITGKDTHPFSEGHKTKPYLGGQKKKEVLREKKHRNSRGQHKTPSNYN